MGPAFVATSRALLEPRRLVPIVLVCAPLVTAQGVLSSDRFAVPLGVAMCMVFMFVAPFAYRALFFASRRPSPLIALPAYGALGAAAVTALAWGVPRVLGMGQTFLTGRTSVLICVALFWVGGWGLARDIELEARLARAERRERELTRAAERAELLAVRSNLDPHFLFNTLNAIAEWCRTDGEVAERAILKLSGMLRTVLDGVRAPTWPLARELELARALFDLHLVRAPSSFTLVFDVDESALSVLVPPLVVLPLIENAMKHGPAAGHTGEVRVAVARAAGDVHIVVGNPGPYRGPRPGSEGLPTVERRLALAYGATAALVVAAEGLDRTRAELRVPEVYPSASEEGP